MSPKVGSEDPAPTPQPIAQLRRDPPVRHAVESGAVQHEKVLFYAAEGGQRGHRGGEERSESQPYASEESGRVVDRSAPRSPTCTSSPSSPSGGSHRTWTFIDRPGSGLVPPAGTVFALQRWRGKGQKRGLERDTRAAAPWPGDRRAEYDRSIAKGGSWRRTCGSILGQEPRAWFQWYTLLVFFFSLGRRTRLDDQTQQTLQVEVEG